MNRKIFVPDLKKRTRKALKSALYDMPITCPDDDVDHYQCNIDILRECLSNIGRLVDQDDCFVNRLACERVRNGLLCHFYTLRLFSGPELKTTIALLEDIDSAIGNIRQGLQP